MIRIPLITINGLWNIYEHVMEHVRDTCLLLHVMASSAPTFAESVDSRINICVSGTKPAVVSSGSTGGFCYGFWMVEQFWMVLTTLLIIQIFIIYCIH